MHLTNSTRVNLALVNFTQHLLQSPPLQIAACVAAIIVTLGHQNPSQLPLARYVSLGAFSLRLQRVELLVQTFFGGFSGVDRATQWGGSWPFFVPPRHFIRDHGFARLG